MNIEDKLTIIARNEQIVYDAGYAAGAKGDDGLTLWKILTGNGVRTNYEMAFYTASFPVGYSFAEPILPTRCQRMFYNMRGIAVPKNVDLSNVQPKDMTSSYIDNQTYALFAYCQSITELYDMGLQAPGMYVSTWAYCRKLKTIEKIRVNKDTMFFAGAVGSTFEQCYALEDVTFEGEIGNNVSFKDCSKLSLASLTNIFSCLYDFVGNGETTRRIITLHIDAYERTPIEMREEAKAKGWSIVVNA